MKFKPGDYVLRVDRYINRIDSIGNKYTFTELFYRDNKHQKFTKTGCYAFNPRKSSIEEFDAECILLPEDLKAELL